MAHLPRTLLEELKNEFAPGAIALLLTGSFVRGEATQYSDVDFWRVLLEPPPPEKPRYQLFIRRGYLVSLTVTTIDEKEAELARPESAVFVVPALRQSQMVYDPRSYLHTLRRKAFDFEWQPLQTAANAYASEELMGYAEEVHKVISGILRRDESMVVYAATALCLALPRIFAVQQGLFIRTENSLFEQVQEAVGSESDWTRLHRTALGMTVVAGQDHIMERGRAALALYRETIAYLGKIILPQHSGVVDNALNAIKNYTN